MTLTLASPVVSIAAAGALGVAVGLSIATVWSRRRDRGRARSTARPSTVYLVGAGPGTIDLLTLKGQDLIASADVLVCDNLVDETIANLAPHGCQFIDVSKRGGDKSSTPQERINEILVAECKNGKRVVRLKGGDPLIFGRVWPEIQALREANCAYELVPGVTSALAAPAAVGIPLTEKTLGRHFTIVSGHKPQELDWQQLGSAVDTLVIIMGTRKLQVICDSLVGGGLSDTTPVTIVQWAYTPAQKVYTGTLQTIVSSTAGKTLSPAIIIIGEVARFAKTPKV